MSASFEPSRFYHVFQHGVWASVSALWGMRWEGLEHVPHVGRVIVAANHISWMDPPLVSMALYSIGRYARFMAKEELFRSRGSAWFMYQVGAIPLDRQRGDVGAVRSAFSVLEREGCMVVFPEGTRSRTGAPGRPKPGVGFLAHQTGSPVVPARVWNTERFPRPARLRVRFGPSLSYSGGAQRDEYRAFAERVMEDILALQ